MSESRLERMAPLTGVVFVGLVVAGTVLINNYEFLPPGEELKSFYEDNSGTARLGHFLLMVSSAFLIWFAGSVRSTLRTAEGGTGRLSAVAFGGGVLAAATILIAHGAGMAAAVRGLSDGGIPTETAITLFDLSGVLMGNAVPIGFAVLLGASAVVSLRTGVFARWLSWVAAVVAVGLLIPEINFAIIGVAVLWVLIMSFVIYRTGNTTVTTS